MIKRQKFCPLDERLDDLVANTRKANGGGRTAFGRLLMNGAQFEAFQIHKAMKLINVDQLQNASSWLKNAANNMNNKKSV